MTVLVEVSADVEQTSKKVPGWFGQATSRYAAPTVEQSKMFALYLHIARNEALLIQNRKKGQRRQSLTGEYGGRFLGSLQKLRACIESGEATIVSHKQAKKYGRLFDRRLAGELGQLRSLLQRMERGQPNQKYLRQFRQSAEEIAKLQDRVQAFLGGSDQRDGKRLIQIRELCERVTATLPTFSWRQPPDLEIVRILKERAVETWRNVNDGKAPRSLAPSGPICQVVVGALEEAGARLSAEEISAILRNKRRVSGRSEAG